MTTSQAITSALKAGPMSAPEIADLSGIRYKTVATTLERMERAGQVTVTRAAPRDRSPGSRQLYSLAAGGAVDLGRVTAHREATIARLVSDIVFEQGEVSLFIGSNGKAALAVHHEPGYAQALQRHGADLVGRYRVDEGRHFLTGLVIEDIRARMAELDKGRAHAA